MDWTLDLDQDSDQDLDLDLGPDLELDNIAINVNKCKFNLISFISIFHLICLKRLKERDQ